jgi:hypothetical protein
MPPEVMRAKCIVCGFIFFTIYDERIRKLKCGSCMPDTKSNAIKVKEWES